MEASDDQQALANSGRHRAPDSEAQTAFIPRITDASPGGVPGGPLDPPAALGQTAPWPAVPGPAVQTHPVSPAQASPAAPVSAADTAVLRTDTPSGAVDPVVARAAAAARAAAKTDAPPATRPNPPAAAAPAAIRLPPRWPPRRLSLRLSRPRRPSRPRSPRPRSPRPGLPRPRC